MRQVIGMLLVILGIAYFAFKGFSYTSKEKMIDIGPIEATSTRHNEIIPYSPLLGGAIIVGGAILFLTGLKRPAS